MHVKEAFEMIDIVMGNLTTTVGNQFLQTGGMVYFNATQNGINLGLADEKSVGVIVATNDVDPQMYIFTGNTVDGQIEWANAEEPLNEFMQEVTQETN